MSNKGALNIDKVVMEVGKIDNRHTWLTHPQVTEQLKQLIAKHPDYPIAILAGEQANDREYYWTYCTSVNISIDELLECNSEWWNKEIVCTDREIFEEEVADKVWNKLNEELGREPTEKEQEEVVKKVIEAHEPYWVKHICIHADN